MNRIKNSQKTPQLGESPLKDIIAAMTINEKISLVMGTGMKFPGLPPEMEGPDVGPTNEKVAGAAGNSFAIPRLGIPTIIMADGPAGVRISSTRESDKKTYSCTAFPIASLLASTWDAALVEKVGRILGNELREYGADLLLAPALNIQRNPLGGRNFEYFSEDPLISGKLAAAIVRGLQSQGVGATLKHFVANNHEWNRFTINVIVSQRALREIYLKSFEIAISEGQPVSIMSSYNKVNGTYTSESKDLLINILREEWKFNGMVMTDWFAGQDVVAQMNAGNDILMPGTQKQREGLISAPKNGKLDQDVIDRNLENILEVIIQSPSFKKYKYSDKPDLKKHAQISRVTATEGMVLLKNLNETLPIKPASKLALFGNSSCDIIIGGTGSGDVNTTYSVSLIEGLKNAGFSISQKLAESYSKYLESEKVKQEAMLQPFMLPPKIPELEISRERIQSLASETELALITLGRRSGEFKDRDLENDFYLSYAENELIKSVADTFHKAHKKVVVVLNIAGVIEVSSWRDKVDAILLAWLPGQEAGNAITDVLSGKVNPSGRLAVTFPIDFQDVPSSSNFPGRVLAGPDPENQSFLIADRAAEVIYMDDIWLGYRYFKTKNVETAYPFGFGLSFTSFEYHDLKISSKVFDKELTVSVTISNRGKVSGREVVQLYLTAPAADLVKPVMELKGFAKTSLLQPGESETITFKISLNDLTSFDPELSAWVAESGVYIINIGKSCMDIVVTEKFQKHTREIYKTVTRSLFLSDAK